MLKLFIPLIALALLTGCVVPPHRTSVTVGVASPGMRMSVHVPAYPDMAPVPGYPVYYAPGLSYNYFFYDGLYWVYYGDYWYSSAWYNGPWDAVHPYYVPTFILRIPVRYYRVPPRHFHGWHPDAPPRWAERWGRDWEQRRSGWDRWDRRQEPARAPLPHYQRDYSGPRYPHAVQQPQLSRDHYRHQPADSMGRDRDGGREHNGRPERQEPWGHPSGPRELPHMGTRPDIAPHNDGAAMPMSREVPSRGMPEAGNIPPPLRREPSHEAQPGERPAGPMAVPGRDRGRDERDNDRRFDRDNDRRGGNRTWR